MDNTVLLIIVAILVLYYFYSKNKQSSFSEIKQEQQEQQVYKLDTRSDYPTVPPVNPNVYKSLIVNSIPVENGLYSNQPYDINGYQLQQDPPANRSQTNQLVYSGGTTQIIKVPLQMNEPFNEQLRTQEIMITPYNRIKYETN